MCSPKWHSVFAFYLKYLGRYGNGPTSETDDEGTDYYGGVFQGCSGFTGNLVIPDNVELIRGYCFLDAMDSMAIYDCHQS